MVATIQFEIHDPSGNQNNVVTINFERDATYEQLQGVSQSMGVDGKLVEFDVSEIQPGNSAFDLSLYAGDLFGVLYFCNREIVPNNNCMAYINTEFSTASELIAEGDFSANMVYYSDNGMTYFFRTFRVAQDVSDLSGSIELSISGLESQITVNIERAL